MLKFIDKIKEVGYDKDLNYITNKLPENKEICKNILKKLNNENVNIKEDNGKEASLYIVATNSIIIANIKNSFTRIQTIAHECIHSTQDKRLLWFNFIFSNIYMLFFAVITILALLNKTNNNWMWTTVLATLGLIFYCVRSYLEMDAMIKARYVAHEYLQEKKGILTKEEINLIVSKYDFINNRGIKLTMFWLLWKCILKIIIFGIATMI